MALTIEEMQKIIMEEVLEEEPTIKGKEADEFRKAIQPDLELAEKMGWVIDIPWVW